MAERQSRLRKARQPLREEDELDEEEELEEDRMKDVIKEVDEISIEETKCWKKLHIWPVADNNFF